MYDPHDEPGATQRQMTTTPDTRPARYPAGPSTGRSHGEASAPGVAEALGHQGVPEEEQPVGTTTHPPLPRAAEAAALHRVARRRRRDPNGQRKQRVDARYSVDEKADILRMARSLNIAGAHYVGAVVMAHIHGDLALPGQRTPLDDYIDELTALRGEVARIGHNVNQIAKKLNSGGYPHPGDSKLLARAEQTLASVGATVRHIAAATNQAVSTTKAPR
ncbi:MobC family plasmid mobilization relaxosome protein [Streptomyces griseoaurantiacus]|uniref:Mobilisation protein (MobC) n=1 Tax=Streptomyces griseoaurantiacus TaxID=68213 RepID=A0A1G7N589_9ACTN|nr:MobC family plasmid mobilization relaxosome protein [Streptomyces jietaisiensis]SDF69203.1 mobilisation protein (MobC) [Streptomyces jietaisiensis]